MFVVIKIDATEYRIHQSTLNEALGKYLQTYFNVQEYKTFTSLSEALVWIAAKLE